jgi:hypothetical protein
MYIYFWYLCFRSVNKNYYIPEIDVSYSVSYRHALLNTRKLPVYSTCRLCQQSQTLNLLVVVQRQCTVGCAADESGMEGGFSAP